MTAREMYEVIDNIKNINPKTNEPIGGDVMDLYYGGQQNEAIKCIQQYFDCDIALAQETFQIFKTKMGAPPSPQQVALANAAAMEWQNKPKCPTCGSANIEKISLTKKAIGGAMFGLFSSNIRNTMHCKNCGYKW